MSDSTQKTPHGTFTMDAADALGSVACLLATAVATNTIGLLDWRQMLQHAVEVITDAALEDGGISEDDLKWKKDA